MTNNILPTASLLAPLAVTPNSPMSSGIITPSASAEGSTSESSSDNSSISVWENGGIFDKNGNNFAMAKPDAAAPETTTGENVNDHSIVGGSSTN